MQTHPKIIEFYKEIMLYAGLKFDESLNYFVPCSSIDVEFKINDQYVTLPTYENLKNPGSLKIMHPLNENYLKPESSFFIEYKKRLTARLNQKLSVLIVSLISISFDPEKQLKVKNNRIIKILSNLKDTDGKTVESFIEVAKRAIMLDDEGYIFDIFLTKNAKVKPSAQNKHAAIGMIVFNMYREFKRAQEQDELPYKAKIRKKDFHNFKNILESIFPNIDREENYQDYTDNQVFRYLNILLKTSYIVASIISELAQAISEDKIADDHDFSELRIDLNWAKILPEIYELTKEIRSIPNQDDVLNDPAPVAQTHRLNIDESQTTQREDPIKNNTISTPVVSDHSHASRQEPQYSSNNRAPNDPQGYQGQAPNTQNPLSAEEILRMPQPMLPGQSYQPPYPLPYPAQPANMVYGHPNQMVPAALSAEEILRMPPNIPPNPGYPAPYPMQGYPAGYGWPSPYPPGYMQPPPFDPITAQLYTRN